MPTLKYFFRWNEKIKHEGNQVVRKLKKEICIIGVLYARNFALEILEDKLNV